MVQTCRQPSASIKSTKSWTFTASIVDGQPSQFWRPELHRGRPQTLPRPCFNLGGSIVSEPFGLVDRAFPGSPARPVPHRRLKGSPRRRSRYNFTPRFTVISGAPHAGTMSCRFSVRLATIFG